MSVIVARATVCVPVSHTCGRHGIRSMCACVRVCVHAWERERERERLKLPGQLERFCYSATACALQSMFMFTSSTPGNPRLACFFLTCKDDPSTQTSRLALPFQPVRRKQLAECRCVLFIHAGWWWSAEPVTTDVCARFSLTSVPNASVLDPTTATEATGPDGGSKETTATVFPSPQQVQGEVTGFQTPSSCHSVQWQTFLLVSLESSRICHVVDPQGSLNKPSPTPGKIYDFFLLRHFVTQLQAITSI